MFRKLLELFSGTHLIGKIAVNYDSEVMSLDKDMDATIKIDILNLDYKEYPPKYFDVTWSSPPCTEYSIAKTTGIRKNELANNIMQRVLEIISYYDPIYYFIENPQTGLLKKQEPMLDIPYKDLDYCKNGMKYREN